MKSTTMARTLSFRREGPWAARAAEVGLALVVIGSALALGGAEVHVELACAVCLMVLGGVGLFGGLLQGVPAPALVLAALGMFSLLQSAPLPLGALGVVSPRAAEVWREALRPLGEQLRFGSL